MVVELALSRIPEIIAIAQLSFEVVWTPKDFSYFVSHERRFAWGFLVEDKLESYLIGLFVQGELDIVSIATHPNLRRQGYAAQLLNFAKKYPGLNRIVLEVDTENFAAVAFYQKHLFSIQGVRKQYYQKKKDAFLMSWSNMSSDPASQSER